MQLRNARFTFVALRQYWKLFIPFFVVTLAFFAWLLSRANDASVPREIGWGQPAACVVMAALITLYVASHVGATNAGHATLVTEHLELTSLHEQLREAHEELQGAHEELESVHEKLRESHEEHDFALQGAPAAYLVVDDVGIVVEVNPAAERMFLGSLTSLEGVPIDKVIPRVEGSREDAMVPVWLREEEARGEFTFVRPDGTHGMASFKLATGHRKGLFVRRIWIWDVSEERIRDHVASAELQRHIATRLAEEGIAMLEELERIPELRARPAALAPARRHVGLLQANAEYVAPVMSVPTRIAAREMLDALAGMSEGAPVEISMPEEALEFVADSAHVKNTLETILRFGLGRLTAFSGAGGVHIKTGIVGPDRLRRYDTAKPRMYFSFAIDGPPLTEPERQCLFRPLVKTEGVPVGFDLADAQRNMKGNGGYIRVEKDRTEGVRVEVHLPV